MTFAAEPPRVPEAAGASHAVAAEGAAVPATLASREYVGLVTRAIAFALDAALINAVAIITAAVAALAFSIVTIPEDLRAVAVAAGGMLYLLWSVGYFVTFWATTGQTPGNRLLRIRVCPAEGGRLRPRRGLVRFVGLTLAALPLFAGFLLILVDNRRRGLHDRLARTVVIDAREDGASIRRVP